MTREVDLQLATEIPTEKLPDAEHLQCWVTAACADLAQFTVTVRIVDEAESHLLNKRYRQQNKPTNVLSFPFDSPVEIDLPLLGDLVICAPLVIREAAEQHKPLQSHWAHLVIHGMLHLQGYVHIIDRDAEIMENLEIALLGGLGIADPYAG